MDYLLNMSWEGVSGNERENLSNALNVYPNPARDRFTISVNDVAPTDLILELVDISGQVVYRNEVRAVYGFQEEIDSGRYAGGVYYLRVNNGRELAIKKVVIE